MSYRDTHPFWPSSWHFCDSAAQGCETAVIGQPQDTAGKERSYQTVLLDCGTIALLSGLCENQLRWKATPSYRVILSNAKQTPLQDFRIVSQCGSQWKAFAVKQKSSRTANSHMGSRTSLGLWNSPFGSISKTTVALRHRVIQHTLSLILGPRGKGILQSISMQSS